MVTLTSSSSAEPCNKVIGIWSPFICLTICYEWACHIQSLENLYGRHSERPNIRGRKKWKSIMLRAKRKCSLWKILYKWEQKYKQGMALLGTTINASALIIHTSQFQDCQQEIWLYQSQKEYVPKIASGSIGIFQEKVSQSKVVE